MANRARGEVSRKIEGVGTVTFALTLAAMAEAEDRFDAVTIDEAIEKASSPASTTSLATLLWCLMQGTKDAGKFEIEAIRKWPITPSDIMELIADLAPQGDPEGNAPSPEAATGDE